MRYLYIVLILFCQVTTFAQNYWGKITYPVYGSVMQGTSISSNNVDVSFQVFDNSLDWRITLWQYDLIPTGTTTRYTIVPVPGYNSKPINDPTLGFTFKSVGNNSSYVYVSGQLKNLQKKQYVLFLHIGTNMYPFGFSDYIALGVGDVYVIAGQSNAAGYNILSKNEWKYIDNIDKRQAYMTGAVMRT